MEPQGYLSRCGCYSLWSECVAPGICYHHAEQQGNHKIALEFDPRSHTEMNSWTTQTMLTSLRLLEHDISISNDITHVRRDVRHPVTWTPIGAARLLLLTVSRAAPASSGTSCQRLVAAAETAPESNIVYVVETRLAAFRPAGPLTPGDICQIWTGDRQRTW